jgi:anti-anti-sigma regulatory factor
MRLGRPEEVDVLKITMTETPAERRWVVQGRLVGPWVSELRTTWKRAHANHDTRTCIIDLNDVTFIDKGGERLLRALAKKGAQLVATGVYIEHVLEEVKNSCMPSAERTRRNSSADRMAQTEEQ